jgi:chemotaxis methyl-accepting protein methylase
MSFTEDSQAEKAPEDLRDIMGYARELRGIDFNAYRASTIGRRLSSRLQKLGLPDYASYRRYLDEHPREIDALIDALTVSISHFFRNPFVFEALNHFVFPELIDTCRNDTLRIWCAGCARGEEAYSLAILLKEISDKKVAALPVFIIATDIDKKALEDAAAAVYPSDSLYEVRKGHLDRYFTREDRLYRVNDTIRSMVTFVRHDVTATPPKEGIFLDYHLILCRNVLIYLNRNTQEEIVMKLAGLLPDGGYLVLGEAETLPLRLSDKFKEVLPQTKIFRKGGGRR